MALFVVAVCTDFIDGAMARTRDQITGLGINLDPVADKVLVGAVLLALGSDYLVIRVLLALMVLEIVFVTAGTVLWMRGAEAMPANVFGKIKMVLLSVGLTLFLVGRLAGADVGRGRRRRDPVGGPGVRPALAGQVRRAASAGAASRRGRAVSRARRCERPQPLERVGAQGRPTDRIAAQHLDLEELAG